MFKVIPSVAGWFYESSVILTLKEGGVKFMWRKGLTLPCPPNLNGCGLLTKQRVWIYKLKKGQSEEA